MQGDVTAAAAKGTDRMRSLDIFLPPFTCPDLASQCAGGTDGHALATELAVQITIIRRRYPGVKTAIGKVNGIHTLHLVTDPDTESAEDAFTHFPFDERILVNTTQRPCFTTKAVPPQLVKIGLLLQCAVTGPSADHAVVGVVGEQQLNNGAAQPVEPVAVRGDLHTFCSRGGAGGNRFGKTLNLNDT